MINSSSSILITGAGGFIGGQFARYLNGLGYSNLVLVDNFTDPKKQLNISGIQYSKTIDRELLFSWLNVNKIDFVIHLGARADTTETEKYIFDALNKNYSEELFKYCGSQNTPLIYASSAATYGDGSKGFSDSTYPSSLRPLNEYARSKNYFDDWIKHKTVQPPFWAGLKFFNVYGEGEHVKGRMASMVNHGYKEIIKTGKISLFKSCREDYKDGEQLRDFIYVKDICRVIYWMMMNKPQSGIYNLGTGESRSFNDLAKAIFKALDKPEQIQYIDMPEQLKKTYQHYTCADMSKLREAGYVEPFTSLEEGVQEYLSYIYKDIEWVR